MKNTSKKYWEQRLAKFGLSEGQIKAAGMLHHNTNSAATYPANDPDLNGAWWNQSALRRRYSYADILGMHRIPASRLPRKVPDWALSNSQCRDLILHLYPRLLADRRIRNKQDMRHARGLRHMAAITALVLYRAYRQLLSDRLDKLNSLGKQLFGEKEEARK